MYFYEDSIYQLNRSIASQNNHHDVQTWLSAAIADEQTCLNGFLDFDLPPYISIQSSSFMQINLLSKLLSNALSICKAVSPSPSANGNRHLLAGDLPEWVSVGDRNLLQSSNTPRKADIVVAWDGSGDYTTICEGLNAAAAARARSGSKRCVVYVKRGVYKENVVVKKFMKNIMLVGDGIDATIVTGSKNVRDGFSGFGSATFAVTGDAFIAQGITFENTAGPEKHQALALFSSSDLSVFYRCSFKGYQDTLCGHSHRQFYRDCDIYGTIDFIFGFSASVIQNCNIYLRQPMPHQKNTITAQGRRDPNEQTGIIIHNSHITRAPGNTRTSFQSYLGRPWREYSRTVFIKCVIDDVIDPAGWLPWSGDFALATLYYGEYMNTGAGADTSQRVKWPGVHIISSANKVEEFTVVSFLKGNSWLPATGVPFTPGL
ncbi:Plant invertase/pectin methylesterase inhibitor superfamily [Perilla frutescens var. hirtella]|nr:Plant invertase/pectin methylesterase inhibitor superfamily [Perilla frutescens var. hirtella]